MIEFHILHKRQEKEDLIKLKIKQLGGKLMFS